MPGVDSAAEVMPPLGRGVERADGRGDRRWGALESVGQTKPQVQALGQDWPDSSVERSIPALKQLLSSAPGEAFAARQTPSDKLLPPAAKQAAPAAPSPDQALIKPRQASCVKSARRRSAQPHTPDYTSRALEWRGWLRWTQHPMISAHPSIPPENPNQPSDWASRSAPSTREIGKLIVSF